MSKLSSATLKVLLGFSLGLAAAEAAFHLRDDGAFPHLNIYIPDAKLGARLAPSDEMRLRVADNPVTTVRTNSRGFRAPEWPAKSEGEILVVGDSQVFGLGVEQDETFAAQLAKLRKASVLNGGVPTYGPREYTAVVEEVAKHRKLSTVVYVVNLSNDLFELNRPNVDRHAVWDGWAVRKETAPESTLSLPFRAWIMGRSHLAFAVRKLWYTKTETSPVAFGTEGTWKDLAATGRSTPIPKTPGDLTREALATQLEVARELEAVAQEVGGRLLGKLAEDPQFVAGAKPLIGKGDPRDILATEEIFAESSRPVRATAFHLFMAAVGEARNDRLLEQLASKGKDTELLALLKRRGELRARLDAVQVAQKPAPTPLEEVFLRTKEICDAEGARLVVIALPLDVMVSAHEWKKYGTAPIDMSVARVLADLVVLRAQQHGITARDATAALAAAEPGAFLRGDLHMTAKGHAAVAATISAALKEPPPSPDALALPEGRSFPPTPDEWRRVREIVVSGSSAAGCETKQVREWVRVLCHAVETPEGRDFVEAIRMEEGGHGDAHLYAEPDEFNRALVVPVVEGDTARATFVWAEHTRQLVLSWPVGAPRAFAFGGPRKLKRGEKDNFTGEWDYNEEPPDPAAPLDCAPGMRAAGAYRRCTTPCDEKTPCGQGHCEPWPTGGFCAVP